MAFSTPLVRVTEFRLNLFYPVLMILMGADYLLSAFSRGMRRFIPVAAILMFSGVGIAHYLPNYSGSVAGLWTDAVRFCVDRPGERTVGSAQPGIEDQQLISGT